MENNLEVALAKEVCIICGKKQDGPIIMNSVLTETHANNVKKLHQQVIGFSEKPCKECQNNINKGFIFIGFDEAKSDMDNLPYGFWRTGHIIGVKKDIPLIQEWVRKVNPNALNKGFMFTPFRIMKELKLIEG